MRDRSPSPEERSKEDDERFSLEVRRYLETSKKLLERRYGISDLTTAEGVKLRHLVEECIRQRDQELAMNDRGEIEGWMVPLPHLEAVARWLNNLYGIDLGQLPKLTPSELREYIHRVRERSHHPGL